MNGGIDDNNKADCGLTEVYIDVLTFIDYVYFTWLAYCCWVTLHKL